MTTWIGPEDAGYDERRALFNAMIDKRPRMIAACETPADVRAALDRAREDGLEVAVRSGGHSVAGQSTNDDGLVIDVRRHEGRRDRPGSATGPRRGWVHLGRSSTRPPRSTDWPRPAAGSPPPVSPGSPSEAAPGWLERKHGLACDNLLAVELVTADGREIRADETQHQDLLWASKGGGGNFGVVTALEFALHPVGPIILGGLMAWPADRGPDVPGPTGTGRTTPPTSSAPAWCMLTGPPEEFVPPHLQSQPMVAIAVCGPATKRGHRARPGRCGTWSRTSTWSARCPTPSSSR